MKDCNLVNIQDDGELHTVTRFLHEVGSLLHYEDLKHNLDDLYFAGPCWLCDLMHIYSCYCQRTKSLCETRS